MARRDEDKKKRRQKRLEHSQRRPAAPSLRRVLVDLKEALDVPMPAHWPGASDPALAAPTSRSSELADYVERREPGKSKMSQLEKRCLDGPLGYLPDINHWAMEEFLYHGLPGDTWHPIEAFLARVGDRYSPAAQEQIRRWKDARIGLFLVGEVRDDLVELQEWDPLTQTAVGPILRAISLNIGSVNIYREHKGKITVSYVAPWAPEQGIVCAMGYGLTLKRADSTILASYLGLRHPEVVAHAWPWNANRAARHTYLRQWEAREWQSWLRDRLEFPFHAVIPLPPDGKRVSLEAVQELIPATAEQARQIGIYFMVPMDKREEAMVVGATNIKLLDLTSPSLAPLSEYQTYRALPSECRLPNESAGCPMNGADPV